MKKHVKHSKLERRDNGLFAPCEISLVGVKCSVISALVSRLSNLFAKQYKMAYIDASHDKELLSPNFDLYCHHSSGNTTIEAEVHIDSYNDPLRFASYDLVFINGNHYRGQRQIVFLDPEKEASIAKRIDQLDNIQFFIKTTEEAQIFDSLKQAFPLCEKLPVYHLEDLTAISAHLEKITQENIPDLKGLVLAGGKSLRMGTDKGLLSYHGIPQRDYSLQLLESAGLETYLSVRTDGEVIVQKTISDAFLGLGPFGAICSAFMYNPNKAYLVLATDLPFVNKELIELLVSKRNSKKIATAIKGKGKEFMEPLIAIWEPKSYPVLLSYLSQGYSCPRKVLINSEVEIVEVEDHFIQNINTPEDFEQAKKTMIEE